MILIWRWILQRIWTVIALIRKCFRLHDMRNTCWRKPDLIRKTPHSAGLILKGMERES